jgi:hypothetical protein
MKALDIKESDFQPLNEFELYWRWSDAEGVIFPETILVQIHALRPQKAQELENYMLASCQKLSKYVYTSIPEDVVLHTEFEMIARMDGNKYTKESITQWLVSLAIPAQTMIFVSWEASLALLLPWQIFCQYWDDFCYPGSDDICISVISGAWCIVYYHEHIFLYGRFKENNI